VSRKTPQCSLTPPPHAFRSSCAHPYRANAHPYRANAHPYRANAHPYRANAHPYRANAHPYRANVRGRGGAGAETLPAGPEATRPWALDVAVKRAANLPKMDRSPLHPTLSVFRFYLYVKVETRSFWSASSTCLFSPALSRCPCAPPRRADAGRPGRFGKCDGYVVVSHGGERFSTRTVKSNYDPEWDESFCFRVSDAKEEVVPLLVQTGRTSLPCPYKPYAHLPFAAVGSTLSSRAYCPPPPFPVLTAQVSSLPSY